MNAQSRAFSIEARIANDHKKGGGKLKPGVFARAVLELGAAEDALTVPEAAITAFAGVSRVFVIEGGLAHERPVDVERRLPDGQVVIRGDKLRAGDLVAVAGVGKLADKVPVAIKAEATP